MDSVAKAGDNTGIGVHFAFGFYGINHQLRRTWHQNNLRFFLDGTRCILWYIFTPNFFNRAYSKGKSWIYYRDKDGKIVGKLQLEAGISIIHTTEIHPKLMVCNPREFQHCSASEADRDMIQFVPEAPDGGFNMDHTRDKWLKSALLLLQTNFPVKNNLNNT